MQKDIKDVLSKQLLRQKTTEEDFKRFLDSLNELSHNINEQESEEHNKGFVKEFLTSAFYSKTNAINTVDKVDLAIFSDKNASSNVDVLIEVKAPNNKSEFPTLNHLNSKALQELVLYFLRERVGKKNIHLKHLIITNAYEWFIFDASDFERFFASDKKFVKLFNDYNGGLLLFEKTYDFYTMIAKPKIAQVQTDLPFTYFDIRHLTSEHKKMLVYKLLCPGNLLKQIKYADSNSLNTSFYHELLYIIGLEEREEDKKKVIARLKEGERNPYSLIENTLYQLSDYTTANEDEQFEIALNLVITWVNRLLFLKLLESQLMNYHKDSETESYRFLIKDKIEDYDGLKELFFKVLAVPIENRDSRVKEFYQNVPYLNSSLFEMTENEKQYFPISGLKQGDIPLYRTSALRDKNGNKIPHEMETLDYLFHFLDAYDFGSEQNEGMIKEVNKTLINASVLGLIFEKINGYKDGSIFTPGMITENICHVTIRKVVLDKFNQHYGWNCKDFDELFNQNYDIATANEIINSVKICDIAVGSGHFLVSALNELISIKAELQVLVDSSGRRLKDVEIVIENDELVIYNDEKGIYQYNHNIAENQRIQETLFNEKRYLIENCLFGVDINPNSVNICRLRLWIELLKNAYYRPDGQLETLPNIDINIKCGNSLLSRFPICIGKSVSDIFNPSAIDSYKKAVEEYKRESNKDRKSDIVKQIKTIKKSISTKQVQLSAFDSEQPQNEENDPYVNSMEWMMEFPEVLDENGLFVGFDAIIGNPPYIEAKKLKNVAYLLKNKFKVYSGTADLSVYFMELGLNLLKQNGRLAFITTNKFFNTGYGKSVRTLMLNHTIERLINCEQVEVFDGILVSSVIAELKKHSPLDEHLISYYKFYKLRSSIFKDLFLSHVPECYRQALLTSDEWSFSNDEELILKDKIEEGRRQIGQIETLHVYRGVTTGYNPAFIISNEKKEELISVDKNNTCIIKNMLQGRNIRKWFYEESTEYLLQTGFDINIKDDYPYIYHHLEQFNPDLSKRSDQGKNWWNLRACQYYKEFEREEKIIWGLTAGNWAYTLDTEYHYLPSNSYIMTSDEMPTRFLLGLLNSHVLQYYFHFIGVVTAGGAYTLKAATIESLPIPSCNKEQMDEVITLVNTILFAKAQDNSVDVTEVEDQLNKVVYKLYGLTDSDIEYIESKISE